MIRVGILTSSRADYGIYIPLLKAINNDSDISFELIVFGTHLSKYHGYTITQIENDGFNVSNRIESFLIGDTPNAISTSYALTSLKFTEFWNMNKHRFDIVFALGDRFEMAAAIAAGIPFQVKFAHIHGGETTLGAIDNIYRHFISLSSSLHFVSNSIFAERLDKLFDGSVRKIFSVGSLSLENIESLNLLSISEFKEKWNIDLEIDSLLVTIHPETIDYETNVLHCENIVDALEKLSSDFQIIITLPNADTSGLIYRDAFHLLSSKCNRVILIENFGSQSYFTCMLYAKLLIGNSSSGIIEAASFKKYVLNLGNRQLGRLSGDNVIHLPFVSNLIVSNCYKYSRMTYNGSNIFFQPGTSKKIINVLKNEYATLL